MKIVIAPQTFKGTLSGEEAALQIEKGILKAFPEAQTVRLPVSDGGDGFLEVILKAKQGMQKLTLAFTPQQTEFPVKWGVLPTMETAVIELAQIAGIRLLPKEKRAIMKATTFGVGQVIKQALDEGYRRILIGVGGSGTNDGGVGIAMALGAEFLDEEFMPLALGGGCLDKLEMIDLRHLDPRLADAEIVVGCDVDNPFTGENGAALIYGPQKGASPEQAQHLERCLLRMQAVVKEQLKIDLHDLPGAGAAGGAAGGLFAFLGAQLVPGIDLVLELLHFEEQIKGADLVITGEGRLDRQTLRNKAPYGVARAAGKLGIPVLALVGSIEEGSLEMVQELFKKIVPLGGDTLECVAEKVIVELGIIRS